MSLVKIKTFKSWSSTRFNDWNPKAPFGCPRKAKFKYLDGIKEPPGPALGRGNVMHKFAELYLLRERPSYAKMADYQGPFCTKAEYAAYSKEWKEVILPRFKEGLDHLRKMGAQAEEAWVFSKNWGEEVAWNDWSRAWFRGKVDAFYLDGAAVHVIDFKTGKVREDHRQQLELYAICAFTLFDAEEVVSELWYFDQDVPPVTEVFKKRALPVLKKKWMAKVKPMLEDTEFKPAPGFKCRWCFYRKDNAENGGGQCEF